jgi:hypothetical protein
MPKDKPPDGKVALITAASRGIGFGLRARPGSFNRRNPSGLLRRESCVTVAHPIQKAGSISRSIP